MVWEYYNAVSGKFKHLISEINNLKQLKTKYDFVGVYSSIG
jgi:hypothetical protein